MKGSENLKSFKSLLDPYKGLPKTVYIIFVSRIINAMGMFIFPLFTLILSEKIGLNPAETGFWLMIMSFTFVPSSMIGGKIADHLGRKKPIIIFETLGAMLYIVCGFMPAGIEQVYVILGACFLFGLAEPAHNAIMADITTPETREGAFSLTYMGFNLGFAIGPVLGGLLFELDLYHWIFWGDAATLLMSLLLIAIYVPETFGQHKAAVSEDRILEQAVEGSTLSVLKSRPILIWFSLILLAYNFAYAQWGYLLPLHSVKNFSDGAVFYGMMASVNGLIVIFFTPIVTRLLTGKRDLEKNFMGGVLYLLGFGGFAFATGKWMFLLCCFVFTIGEIIVTISFMPFLANRTPASHRGRISAVVPLIMGTGRAFGPLIMGNIIQVSSIETGWKVVGMVMVVGVFFMKVLDLSDAKRMVTETEAE